MPNLWKWEFRRLKRHLPKSRSQYWRMCSISSGMQSPPRMLGLSFIVYMVATGPTDCGCYFTWFGETFWTTTRSSTSIRNASPTYELLTNLGYVIYPVFCWVTTISRFDGDMLQRMSEPKLWRNQFNWWVLGYYQDVVVAKNDSKGSCCWCSFICVIVYLSLLSLFGGHVQRVAM